MKNLLEELRELWSDNYVAFSACGYQMCRCRAITTALANVEDIARGWLSAPMGFTDNYNYWEYHS